jgi:hypothetical protein
MNFRRRLFVAAVTGVSLAGSMTVVASPANASSKYGSCGSGWSARGRAPINNSSNSADKLVGYVYWVLSRSVVMCTAALGGISTAER